MAGAGCLVESLSDLATAFDWAEGNDQTTVIFITTDALTRVPGDADCDVAVPEVSTRDNVNAARDVQIAIRAKQRVGV